MHNDHERLDDDLAGLVRRLKSLPPADERARGAILARVRGRRQVPWRTALAMAWEPSIPFLAAATLAVSALGAGYGARVLVEPAVVAPAAVIADRASGETADAALVSDNGLVPVQFVLSSADARSVSLVGDFNGWGETRTALNDPTGTGVWEATVQLPPGRHTYVFLVNDSVWTIDPRASASASDDYGRTSSVVLVTGR